MALIAVDDLVFRYPHAAAPVLDGVTVAFEPGERVAILAANGGGKSTFARWLAGLLPEGELRAERGEVRLDGRPWSAWTSAERCAAVQFVGQVPAQQLSGAAFTVYEEVAFGPCNLALPADEIRRRVDAALASCNLTHLSARNPFTLSGGEQQRLAIAAALAMQPRVLVLDEPTSNLDPESRDALIEQLRTLPDALTVIVLEVALRPCLAIADRFLLLAGGRIAVDGPAIDVLLDPRTVAAIGMTTVAQTAAAIAAAGAWPAGLALPLGLDDGPAAFGEAAHALGR
jgi:energy-coupling factor transporter ATP-binding protein EcfA2